MGIVRVICSIVLWKYSEAFMLDHIRAVTPTKNYVMSETYLISAMHMRAPK